MSERRGKRHDVLSELLRTIRADETEIPMLSTAPYADKGRLRIDGERLRYASKSPGWFHGCERGIDSGAGGTEANAHPGGTWVWQDNPDEVGVSQSGLALVSRPLLNFLAGDGITVAVTDDPANDRADVAITLDADLTTIAANITAAGHALLDDADAAAQRATLGLAEPGLVLIDSDAFSASSAVNVNSVFTATYDTYRLMLFLDMSASGGMTMRLRAGGVDASGASYYWGMDTVNSAGATGGAGSAGATSWNIYNASGATAAPLVIWMDIFQPHNSDETNFKGGAAAKLATPAGNFQHTGGFYNATTSYDGFSLIPTTGNITGTLRIYGHKDTP